MKEVQFRPKSRGMMKLTAGIASAETQEELASYGADLTAAPNTSCGANVYSYRHTAFPGMYFVFSKYAGERNLKHRLTLNSNTHCD